MTRCHVSDILKLTGAFGKGKDTQLRNFATALKRKTHVDHGVPRDWSEAFEMLREYIESLPARDKQVVFFDEMPWLDNQKSDFLPTFEWFWNDWASTRKNLVFIACGSATSWMDEKIANNRGGLFNRQTCKLFLKPFRLNEVKEYLVARNIKWSDYDIVRCYMIMGGLTRDEIIEKTGLKGNGDLSKILSNLELSGFIRVSGYYQRKRKCCIRFVIIIRLFIAEFKITKEYDLKLRNKVESFRNATKCKDSLQLVMITTYGVKKNEYSGLIQNQVTMQDLFF